MQAKRHVESLGVLEPKDRMRALINFSSAVEVDPSVPPRRYYRSGLEMVRMANVYLDEGSLENALVLYLKFMTLFLEKIRHHPDYANVPPSEKQQNQFYLREILPKAENLKTRLLEQFTKEYNQYLIDVKRHQAEDKRRRELEKERQKKRSVEVGTDVWPTSDIAIQPLDDLGGIYYPDPNVPSAPPADDEGSSKSISTTPSIDRATKPATNSVTIPTPTLTKPGLRTVVIPSKVMTHFLTLSHKSTMNNIETCGILAGKLERNNLIITHVILPKQNGTSDSCTTMNEEEIFEYQDQHNLITIGWIHTHPTQTAFLSSVDLHTHCPYQLLMPEAIAIVCAPKYEETGFFILTPNYGLSYISNCKKSGFHPHPTEPPLFMNAEHVKVDGNAALEVLDLR
uniref:MPN domain-containing protein n=1 Tax=Photinus pyralis TaxID=7054 RepID=A0A1Y1JXA6_PHOPY